jgi:cytochrome c-type biogenesis protein CcmE
MPPESVWMVLLKVVLATVLGVALGSGITLYGMRQNNKHNATENKANREHQLEVEIAKAEIAAKHRSNDRRWE